MPDFIDERARNPGPAVLGHDPVILPDARERVVGAVEGTGAVEFRNSPALPWLRNPKR